MAFANRQLVPSGRLDLMKNLKRNKKDYICIVIKKFKTILFIQTSNGVVHMTGSKCDLHTRVLRGLHS